MNKTLINAITRRVGKDSLQDIMDHGADAGYPGITYYSDTCSFFRSHRQLIIELANDMASDLGESVVSMVKSFRCLNNDFSEDEIARVLYGPWKVDDAHTLIGNAMTWFAAEEVARYVCDK